MSDVIAKATEQLLKLVDEVHANYGDRYNPETYIVSRKFTNDHLTFTVNYVLGNLYLIGTIDGTHTFEIFKDHSTWQVFYYKRGAQRPDRVWLSRPIWDIDKVKSELANLIN